MEADDSVKILRRTFYHDSVVRAATPADITVLNTESFGGKMDLAVVQIVAHKSVNFKCKMDEIDTCCMFQQVMAHEFPVPTGLKRKEVSERFLAHCKEHFIFKEIVLADLYYKVVAALEDERYWVRVKFNKPMSADDVQIVMAGVSEAVEYTIQKISLILPDIVYNFDGAKIQPALRILQGGAA